MKLSLLHEEHVTSEAFWPFNKKKQKPQADIALINKISKEIIDGLRSRQINPQVHAKILRRLRARRENLIAQGATDEREIRRTLATVVRVAQRNVTPEKMADFVGMDPETFKKHFND